MESHKITWYRILLLCTFRFIEHIYISNKTTNKIPPTQAPPILILAPSLGLPLSTTAVAVAEREVQLTLPHAYPLGQQFPPSLTAQLVQPVAHAPVGLAEVAAGPTGTAIVRPLLMMVVELVVGQETFSQFRPTRQHPPS